VVAAAGIIVHGATVEEVVTITTVAAADRVDVDVGEDADAEEEDAVGVLTRSIPR
jgi:hypothetical protein